MKKIFLLVLLTMGLFSLSVDAQAYTMYTLDFENLSHADDQIVDIDPVYQSGDFILTNTATAADSGFDPAFATVGTENDSYTGSTSLFNDNYAGETVLTAADGQLFKLYSIDLAELFAADYSFDVTFIGYLEDGSTISQIFSLDGLFGAETFAFDSAFTNLTAVSWTQSLDFHQFDNINAQLVPEPSTFFLVVVGLLGLALVNRERKSDPSGL